MGPLFLAVYLESLGTLMTDEHDSRLIDHNVPLFASYTIQSLLLQDPILGVNLLLPILSLATLLCPSLPLVPDLFALTLINSNAVRILHLRSVTSLGNFLLTDHQAKVHLPGLTRVGIVNDYTTTEAGTLSARSNELNLII